eukprot:Opistho-1_new@9966
MYRSTGSWKKRYAPLLQAYPLLGQVLVIDSKEWRKGWIRSYPHIKAACQELRKKEYEAVFDLQGNGKSALVCLLARAKKKIGFSWSSLPEKINLLATNRRYLIPLNLPKREGYLLLLQKTWGDDSPFTPSKIPFTLKEEENLRLLDLLQKPCLSSRPRFMVAMGSLWKNKQLPLATWVEWCTLIAKEYAASFLFVYGSEKEKKEAEYLENFFPSNSLIVGEMSIAFWQALMNQVEGVLAVDSAALHLCGLTATPSFSVFGPSKAAIYKPSEASHQAYQAPCPYAEEFVQRCPYLRSCPTGACMGNLTAKELFTSFTQWWRSLRRRA